MKVEIGDVIEIMTGKGLAYALYTHRHDNPPRYGAMLRVFDRLYVSRPSSFETIVDLPVQFTTFFPLQAAVDNGIVEVVAKVRVPENLRSFPVFRSGMLNPQTNKVTAWWLWDGENEWKVGALTPEQRKLPIRGVWNDTFLIERIEEGWRAEKDASYSGPANSMSEQS